MAPSLSLRGLMVVICSLAVLSLAQTLNTLYVKPTSNTPCDKDPCLTLMEYADNASQYFTRDTEAVFLSGQHLLEIDILINNTVTFIMCKGINASQSHPEIVCTAAVGIIFFNVSFVSITELSFAYCGTATTGITNQKWALTSYSVGLFVMANATVRMSHGTAVFTFNTTFHSFGNHIQDNTASIGGGILAESSNVSIENCYFYNNSVTGFVGGAVSVNNSLIVFSGVNTFADNKAEFGGGIFLSYSSMSFEGSNTFIHNSANRDGGAIYSEYSIIKFSGNTTFKNNSAISSSYSTSALYVINSEFITFTGATTFTGNGPSINTLFFDNCTAAIEGTLTFEYNQGGLAVLGSNNITIRGITKFLNNSATFIENNVLSVRNSRVTFSGNTIFAGNSPVKGHKFGAVYVDSSTVQFMGHTTFTDNGADTGSAVYAIQANVEFVGTQSFEQNVASEMGGAIYMFNSMVDITGCCNFINNSAGTVGGAISNTNGQLYITGNTTFAGNQALHGGGLYFEFTNSRLFFISPLKLLFQNNSAVEGGAIYVYDATNTNFCFSGPVFNKPTSIGSCFIQVESLSNNLQLDFDGNTASDRGENIFGGMLDKCSVNDNMVSPERGLSLLIDKLRTNISTVSSEPLRLCFCINGQVNCTYDPPPFSIVRGATISVSAVALDQVNHPVVATIRSYFPYNNGTVSELGLGQEVQRIGATCTTLSYTILTTAPDVEIILYPEGPCGVVLQRQISVHLLSCPIAFKLSGEQCITGSYIPFPVLG